MNTSDLLSELEAWREVHQKLTEAVLVGKEAVTAAKAQRRYWLEEIAANLTTDGKLTATSVWKKPSKVKALVKRRSLPKAVTKRKKSDDTETDEEEPLPKKKKTVIPKSKKLPAKKLKLSLSQLKFHSPNDDEEDDDSDDEENVDDESVSSPLEASGYSTQEQEAAAGLLAGTGGDMSHIPEELRPFMASLDVGLPSEEITPVDPISIYGGKALRTYNYDDDDDDDDED